jgi:hypothetical protein
MSTRRRDVRAKNQWTMVVMLGVSALLALLSVPGIAAGFALALLVLVWLLRASNDDVQNRSLVIGLAVLSLAMNGVFLIGAFT